MATVYQELKKFKKKYPLTVAWRLKNHADIIEKHLNPGESVIYAFVGQKGTNYYDLFSTCAIALTTERILIGRSRVIAGYSLDSVMPYMFNDLNVRSGLFWGKICIDTAKEEVIVTKLDNLCLSEVETAISENMQRMKLKYLQAKKEKESSE